MLEQCGALVCTISVRPRVMYFYVYVRKCPLFSVTFDIFCNRQQLSHNTRVCTSWT